MPLDSALLLERPLPRPEPGADKNERGRVLAIGGSAGVPGGVALTAEAALRAGAGKVQVAVPAPLALPLGVAMPEIGVIALAETGGEIADCTALGDALAYCDAVVAGPAMASAEAGERVADALLEGAPVLVLDAMVLTGLAARADAVKARGGRTILTPHPGEMAALLECEPERITADPAAAAREGAARYGAVTLVKGPTTFIADPDGALFAFAGGGVGLATGGSGDVLAGIAAALAARGAAPLDAALWAVWLHGEAGRRCGEQVGPVGFLARELLPLIPSLMRP
ncbi:NAD(P)H-hydrate dehydratase [Parablastomonas sp. CN1-191]|uniref:NAD(P)H-hydrate dehydratase n=1 Tax=Parablastomonas sp. CN1-191 TaxID=3400908 RepID=UPI003BF84FF5